jgi:hypothetical protein
MSRMLYVDTISPAVSVSAGTTRADRRQERGPRPLALDVRGVILKTGFGLCNLEVTSEGQITPVAEVPERPLKNLRLRLSAIRIVRDCDTRAFNQLVDWQVQKDKREATQDETRGATSTAATVPPPQGWERHTDLVQAIRALEGGWLMTTAVRGQILVAALDRCGFAVTLDGEITPSRPAENSQPPIPRIVHAALKILVAYENLSTERKLVDLRTKLDKEKGAEGPGSRLDRTIVDPVVEVADEEPTTAVDFSRLPAYHA